MVSAYDFYIDLFPDLRLHRKYYTPERFTEPNENFSLVYFPCCEKYIKTLEARIGNGGVETEKEQV